MQLGYYEFAGYGDLFLLGAIGLILVVRNWWDIIRYGIGHAAEGARIAEPAPGRLSLRHVASAVRRLRRRGSSSTHRPHGHRHA